MEKMNVKTTKIKHTKLKKMLIICIWGALCWTLLANLTSCTPAPPKSQDNICKIFREYPSWYWDAEAMRSHWGLPISVLMAVVHQESRFNAKAKPPRRKLLWIIPWFRPTSAYGYSQAVNETWKHYKRDTGHSHASRDAFGDAADFIGWYTNQAHIRLGISKSNAYAVYLAYHEGIVGYARRTYTRKKWLMDVSRNVQRRAWVYRSQLLQCEASLPKKPWWRKIF